MAALEGFIVTWERPLSCIPAFLGERRSRPILGNEAQRSSASKAVGLVASLA